MPGSQYTGTDNFPASVYRPDDSSPPKAAEFNPSLEGNRDAVVYLKNRIGLYRLHKRDKAHNEPADDVALAVLKEWNLAGFSAPDRYEALTLSGANAPATGDLVEIQFTGNCVMTSLTTLGVGIIRAICSENGGAHFNEPGCIFHNVANATLTSRYASFGFSFIHPVATGGTFNFALNGRLSATEANRKIQLLEGWRVDWRIWRPN